MCITTVYANLGTRNRRKKTTINEQTVTMSLVPARRCGLPPTNSPRMKLYEPLWMLSSCSQCLVQYECIAPSPVKYAVEEGIKYNNKANAMFTSSEKIVSESVHIQTRLYRHTRLSNFMQTASRRAQCGNVRNKTNSNKQSEAVCLRYQKELCHFLLYALRQLCSSIPSCKHYNNAKSIQLTD